jgi:hypothetical protein
LGQQIAWCLHFTFRNKQADFELLVVFGIRYSYYFFDWLVGVLVFPYLPAFFFPISISSFIKFRLPVDEEFLHTSIFPILKAFLF